MVYLITYDLNNSGKNYKGLEEAIKSASSGAWTHCMDSVWLIESNFGSESEVFRVLKPSLDSDDHCLVVKVVEKPAGRLNAKRWDYINTHLLFH